MCTKEYFKIVMEAFPVNSLAVEQQTETELAGYCSGFVWGCERVEFLERLEYFLIALNHTLCNNIPNKIL